jgi:hypothetical protein
MAEQFYRWDAPSNELGRRENESWPRALKARCHRVLRVVAGSGQAETAAASSRCLIASIWIRVLRFR